MLNPSKKKKKKTAGVPKALNLIIISMFNQTFEATWSLMLKFRWDYTSLPLIYVNTIPELCEDIKQHLKQSDTFDFRIVSADTSSPDHYWHPVHPILGVQHEGAEKIHLKKKVTNKRDVSILGKTLKGQFII